MVKNVSSTNQGVSHTNTTNIQSKSKKTPGGIRFFLNGDKVKTAYGKFISDPKQYYLKYQIRNNLQAIIYNINAHNRPLEESYPNGKSVGLSLNFLNNPRAKDSFIIEITSKYLTEPFRLMFAQTKTCFQENLAKINLNCLKEDFPDIAGLIQNNILKNLLAAKKR